MCGIFGIVSTNAVDAKCFNLLSRHAQQRGRDSSGVLVIGREAAHVWRADYSIQSLLKRVMPRGAKAVLGHSRLITNGLADNQPVVRGGVCVFHNGIVVNHADLWAQIGEQPRQEIDTEVIAAIAARHLADGGDVNGIADRVLSLCRGVVACALAIPSRGKLCLFSNNGSLYAGSLNGATLYASEEHPLRLLECSSIHQIRSGEVLDIPVESKPVAVSDDRKRRLDLIPNLASVASAEERMLEYPQYQLRRCTRCILPHTMPFISFDEQGVCNYCRHYRPRNNPRPKEELFGLVNPYRRASGAECIVPFSGGRDSCYGLHLIANELKMRPVTYTYDWGMVTDLGRRNISRMCGELGVENIIVAEDIAKKREYIRMNLRAWLRSPHLGMISILTAGDKHFFRHVETVKRQTGVQLNLWGVNPLEVTHFKAGFLGVPPDFAEKRVYSHGMAKQLRYHWLRLRAMLQSPGYFNRSLWDTLSGEYYRSFTEKKDYFHIFDYWRWDERVVDETLAQYDWERAPDTSTTWRIGDGTAAFYNYIYYTVAGFSEHDTFRSNQVREGDLSRERAIKLVQDENRPRYPNIKWYLDAVGLDFREVIKVVNAIPPLAGSA
ncbi:MAG: glucosamine 6-phosphate synthetase [Planctomycetes bacterium]|nr:glucosamine 6-phosphate synthetase [Planctomycetota bacterium]